MKWRTKLPTSAKRLLVLSVAGVAIWTAACGGSETSSTPESEQKNGSSNRETLSWKCPATPSDLEAIYPGGFAFSPGVDEPYPNPTVIIEGDGDAECDFVVFDGATLDDRFAETTSWEFSFTFWSPNLNLSPEDELREQTLADNASAVDSPCEGTLAVKLNFEEFGGNAGTSNLLIILPYDEGSSVLSAANDTLAEPPGYTDDEFLSSLPAVCDLVTEAAKS